MYRFRHLLKRHKPVKLGRWNGEQTGRKAELANHDHCGGPLCKAPPSKNMKMVEHCETERVEYYETEMVEHYDSDMDSALCALQSFQLYPNEQSKRRGK
jgi:hypothetical protein